MDQLETTESLHNIGINNAAVPVDPKVLSNVANIDNNGTTRSNKYDIILWKPYNYPNLLLTNQEWSYIFDEEKKTFRTQTYVNFFTKKLNSIGIACVLVAGNKYGRYSCIFRCKHEKCTRLYKLISPMKNLMFDILYFGEIIHDPEVKTTRPLNGDLRDEAKSQLRTMGVREFSRQQNKAADRNLTSQGNLDTIKSKTTYEHLKSEVLSENDLDKDHIVDLSKMRDDQKYNVSHHIPGSEVYIQHVSSNDFFVHAFSATQIRILKELLDSGLPITIHVDATGSIIMAPEGVTKRIYYYVASVALPILDEKTKMLFPIAEMISSAHDAFTIETWLRKVKTEFIRQVGAWKAPAHFVTDFSFAILNAAASGLNNEDLIDYVNRCYDAITSTNKDERPKPNKTEIFICCNHFIKTSAKDVDTNFPASQSSRTIRTFLKETLALMFNMTDLELLAKFYQHLSAILNSKYITKEVEEALYFITGCVKESEISKQIEIDEAGEENVEILEFDEPKDGPIYKQSKFYQMFEKLTSRPNYNNASKELNNFYCPTYCDLLMSKYIPILPLWTCLNCEKRQSNSNAESLFNIIKSRLKQFAPIIGHVPIRSSRFLRFTREMINETAQDFWDQLPRLRCCNRKRVRSTSNSPQSATKRKRFNSPKSSPSVCRNIGTSPGTPSRSSRRLSQFIGVSQSATSNAAEVTPRSSQSFTPKSSRPCRVMELSSQSKVSKVCKSPSKSSRGQSVKFTATTPTSSCYIGDPNATESWGATRKKPEENRTYFHSNLLKKFDSPKVMEQIFKVKDKRVTSSTKLKNCLFDDPHKYFSTNEPFIVAASALTKDATILSSSDFKSLQRNEPVTLSCMQFLLKLFSKKRKDVQFTFFVTPQLIIEKLPIIQKENVLGIIHESGKYSLLSINVKKKIISFIDLTMKYPKNQMLENFLKLMADHNKLYKTSFELQGWKHIDMQYPHLEYGNIIDSGVYIIRFIQDLITRNFISKKEFDVDQYRLSLCHYILNKSACMLTLCLICGLADDQNVENPMVDWIECEKCRRWCHKACLKSTVFNIAFFCILCSE